LLGEVLTGRGPLAQLNIETGLSVSEISTAEPLVLLVIVFNLVAAVFPSLGLYVPESEDFDDRNAEDMEDKLGSGFGPTKNQLFLLGRITEVLLAVSLAGELITGSGPLTSLELDTGVSVAEANPLVVLAIIFLLVAPLSQGKGRFYEEKV
jgi:photosystem II protein